MPSTCAFASAEPLLAVDPSQKCEPIFADRLRHPGVHQSMQDTKAQDHHTNRKLFAGRKNRTLPLILIILVALVAFVALLSAFIGQAQSNP